MTRQLDKNHLDFMRDVTIPFDMSARPHTFSCKPSYAKVYSDETLENTDVISTHHATFVNCTFVNCKVADIRAINCLFIQTSVQDSECLDCIFTKCRLHRDILYSGCVVGLNSLMSSVFNSVYFYQFYSNGYVQFCNFNECEVRDKYSGTNLFLAVSDRKRGHTPVFYLSTACYGEVVISSGCRSFKLSDAASHWLEGSTDTLSGDRKYRPSRFTYHSILYDYVAVNIMQNVNGAEYRTAIQQALGIHFDTMRYSRLSEDGQGLSTIRSNKTILEHTSVENDVVSITNLSTEDLIKALRATNAFTLGMDAEGSRVHEIDDVDSGILTEDDGDTLTFLPYLSGM